MAKHSVDMVIKARDEASRKLLKVGGAAMSMGGMLRKAAAIAATYFSARAIMNFSRSSLAAFGVQEEATISLGQALENLNKRYMMPELKSFAQEMQKVTKYGDEQILSMMQLFTSLGVLPEKLQEATKMAIGLAAATGRDVKSMSQYVALAMQGEFTMLRRYIPALRATTDETEQLRIVQDFAAKGFQVAASQAKTYAGTVIQMKNAYGDLKEEIGKSLMPVFKEMAIKIKQWIEENKQRVAGWANRTVNMVILINDVFADFVNFMKSNFTGGMKWVFDSFLTLMKAAFREAIRMAVIAGEAIWAGLTGKMATRIDINTEAMKRYNAAGYGTKVAQRPGGGIMNISGPIIERVGPDNPALLEQITEEVEREFRQKRIKDLVENIVVGVGDEMENAFRNVVESMPPELKESVKKSYKEYLDRLAKIASDEFDYIPGLPAFAAIGKGSSGTKKAGQWSPMISQTMSHIPGTFADPAIRVAIEQKKIAEASLKEQQDFNKNIKDVNRTLNETSSEGVDLEGI